jgi:seryl-tRNA synthetase
MLDPKFIRNNIDLIKKTLLNHTKEGVPKDILEQFLNHDIKSRSDISKLQELNTKRNNLTSLFEHTKDNVEKEKLKKEVITFKNQIEELNNICNENDKKMHEILFSIPNILDDSVPIGETEEDNVELRKFGTIRTDKVLPHYEIGVKLNLLDFERGAKISGTRGYILKGNGSKLLRALRDFTLDLAEQNGYVEIQPPMLIKEELLYGLGKIPFFQEDMYATADKTYLPATEEFAITAMHANETLLATNLPLKYTGSCVNYRKEAGSAGKDVRGILRVHYF